jgi:hypothetical protein
MRCYVSYAWAEEGNPDREAQVYALIAQARRKGVVIVWDKDALKVGDRTSDFMRKIGGGDRVFIFLSHKYLTSPFCMNELFWIWKHSREDESDFLGCVRVYKLDDARFEQFEDRLRYAKYWRSEHDRLEEIVKGSLREVSEFDYRRFRLMDQFVTNIGDILTFVSTMERPRTFEEFLKYSFEDAYVLRRPVGGASSKPYASSKPHAGPPRRDAQNTQLSVAQMEDFAAARRDGGTLSRLIQLLLRCGRGIMSRPSWASNSVPD